MKTFWELREKLNEGKYVGGPQHTWPQHIGANNSSQANKIKTALNKAGHSFKDHGDLPANKKANKHFISMKDKEGHAALMKLKKTHMKNEDFEDQNEGVMDTVRQGVSKLKSMTPAAKAAKKAAADKKAMDDMGKSIMSLAMAKKR